MEVLIMNLLITGANRGLGLELTTEACARGHRVLAGIRSPESSQDQINELQLRYPSQITIVPLDTSEEHSIMYAATQVALRHSHIDGIINSAAILLGRDQKIEDLSIEDMENSFQTNLYGPMLVIKHFLPLLKKGTQQSIINISSEAGSFSNAYGGDYSYALTKSALNMFSAQLHKQFTPHGYQVYAIHPGWIRTDMGGDKAPGDASVSARGIIDIIERKTQVNVDVTFIDFNGQPMPM
jgi:NAD(P)-dependent dehydrogenase (short-subunit alcohol dehydrogenase family)